ncbi:hypothetical protein N7462_010523 [Penicillium macrosclerotiorum]|uniref:uncharacterized protein n=1 Tax=Penicillium macrosclerotiorum TaxID=303699 RepID=UPI0025468C8B|nr:uncharacterized protein N7462_010523 [Penicillium macrosclerotiorum]KAJ5669453.1 hypothetical protein N7462_010523 [Penicillium macrosclerotiorum]
MRFTSLITLLPALALAQEQVPLADRVQGWFNKAKAYVPTAVPADPIEKMAEKVAEKRVTDVTMQNWQSILTPAEQEQDWLVFVTGGNKTCFGRCEHAEKAFKVSLTRLMDHIEGKNLTISLRSQESVLLFSADPTAPNLGLLNCEEERVLCATWSAGAPSVFYYQVPQAPALGEERLPTPLHIVYMNSTTVTPEELYQIHSKKTFEKVPAYEGILHPIDGLLAQYQLNVPLGYAIFAIGAIPSWMFMIGISFFSRTFM